MHQSSKREPREDLKADNLRADYMSRRLTLYTNHLTPDGLKVSIYLEELKAVDPAAFEYK